MITYDFLDSLLLKVLHTFWISFSLLGTDKTEGIVYYPS